MRLCCSAWTPFAPVGATEMRGLCLVYVSFMPSALSLQSMTNIALFLMRLLEIAFMVGLAGSAIVVVRSFIEDFGELFRRDK